MFHFNVQIPYIAPALFEELEHVLDLDSTEDSQQLSIRTLDELRTTYNVLHQKKVPAHYTQVIYCEGQADAVAVCTGATNFQCVEMVLITEDNHCQVQFTPKLDFTEVASLIEFLAESPSHLITRRLN